MAEEKKDEKKYTQDDINKLVTDRVMALKRTEVSYEIKRNWDHLGGTINPRLTVDISGGSVEFINELAIRIQEMMLELQKAKK
jgi:Cu/Ag efflux pump CusA